MTKPELHIRRAALVARLADIGHAPLDTPAGRLREEIVAELRNTHAAIKQLVVDGRPCRDIHDSPADLQIQEFPQ